jgi:fumarate reductase flavoprotein subunit
MVELFRVAAGAPKAVEGVVDTETDGEDTVYTVEVTGLNSMTVEVTIDATGTITAMEVTDHTETAGIGGVVIDGDFIQGILDNQTDLDGIDTVAGATMTSEALVDAARKALEQYNG